jgi:hypothetical protein
MNDITSPRTYVDLVALAYLYQSDTWIRRHYRFGVARDKCHRGMIMMAGALVSHVISSAVVLPSSLLSQLNIALPSTLLIPSLPSPATLAPVIR